MAIKKVFYRSPHNYDLDEASNEAAVKEFGPSLTVQSMAEDCDLNVIMARFGVTGKMPDNVAPLFYGDFDGIYDFRSAQDALRNAIDTFEAMPAEVRSRFGNDPQMFLEFCDNRDADGKLVNLEEMRKLGLAIPEKIPDPEPKPMKVEVVNPTPAKPA